ncbi:MAG: hypothetical protein RIC89_08575 [Pseudomonadales bacterium]
MTSRARPGFYACQRARLALFCVILMCLGSPGAYGATQGSAGDTSTGSVDISYVQGLNARINGFDDLSLGTWSGSGPMTANDDLCVARTGVGFFGLGAYRILASGDGAPGDPAAFTLSNGTGSISYNAYFNDQTGTTGRQPLTPGAVLTGQSGSGTAFFFNLIFGCAWLNANVSVEVPASELSGAAGVYSGTLTLTLIPE